MISSFNGLIKVKTLQWGPNNVPVVRMDKIDGQNDFLIVLIDKIESKRFKLKPKTCVFMRSTQALMYLLQDKNKQLKHANI